MSLASHVLDEVQALMKSHEIWRWNELQFTHNVPEDELALTQASLLMAEPKHVHECSLLWISPDMVDLLLHAALSLPPYEFSPSVLPWPKAVCIAAKPLIAIPHPVEGSLVPVTAVQWSDFLADPNGLHVVVPLAHIHGPDVLSPTAILTLTPGVKWENLRGGDEPERLSPTMVLPSWNLNMEVGRLMCTLWLLVQQKVAVRRPATADRAGRRRWERNTNRPLPEVTIIELRRPVQTSTEDRGDHGFVDWSHRWIVDGHWRNQWHAKTEEHVPTWIAPYVKGPDDKPLVVKKRINAWVR